MARQRNPLKLPDWHDIDMVVADSGSSRARWNSLPASAKPLSRRLCEKPLCRSHLHHAGSGVRKGVRQRLNPIASEFAGKETVLLWWMIPSCARRARKSCRWRGRRARRVFFASAAPPVIYPNVYGIDMPTPSELIAVGKTRAGWPTIGADRVIYRKHRRHEARDPAKPAPGPSGEDRRFVRSVSTAATSPGTSRRSSCKDWLSRVTSRAVRWWGRINNRRTIGIPVSTPHTTPHNHERTRLLS